MAKIPLTAQLLYSSRPQDLYRLLIAALIHLQADGDEEGLIVTQADLDAAANYTLVTTDMTLDEKAFVLSVRPR